jgi:hypothetical protein
MRLAADVVGGQLEAKRLRSSYREAILALQSAGKKPVATARRDSTRWALGSCRPPHLFRSAGDKIDIAGGSLTFVVTACANWFYRHRRPRWALAKTS